MELLDACHFFDDFRTTSSSLLEHEKKKLKEHNMLSYILRLLQ